eukprot:scaffold9866_cov108-Isochrysis_galbana.AAC.1
MANGWKVGGRLAAARRTRAVPKNANAARVEAWVSGRLLQAVGPERGVGFEVPVPSRWWAAVEVADLADHLVAVGVDVLGTRPRRPFGMYACVTSADATHIFIFLDAAVASTVRTVCQRPYTASLGRLAWACVARMRGRGRSAIACRCSCGYLFWGNGRPDGQTIENRPTIQLAWSAP